jgi:hypothetical protein
MFERDRKTFYEIIRHTQRSTSCAGQHEADDCRVRHKHAEHVHALRVGERVEKLPGESCGVAGACIRSFFWWSRLKNSRRHKKEAGALIPMSKGNSSKELTRSETELKRP